MLPRDDFLLGPPSKVHFSRVRRQFVSVNSDAVEMTAVKTRRKDTVLLREIGTGTETLDLLSSAMEAPSRQQLQRKNRITGRW
jgi:hypothetical protein